jgi:hypothetical protein
MRPITSSSELDAGNSSHRDQLNGLGKCGNGSYDALGGTLDNMVDFSHPARGKSNALILDPGTGEVFSGH